MPFDGRAVFGPLNRWDPIALGPAVLTREEVKDRELAQVALKHLRGVKLSPREVALLDKIRRT